MAVISLSNGNIPRAVVSDGEAVDPVDFNNLSSWYRAQINDYLVGAHARYTARSNAMNAFFPFAIGNEGALRIYVGSGVAGVARSFGCNAGTIYQYSGTLPDGKTPRFLAYRLNTDEITGQCATDGGNNRIDAICVRISEVDGPLTTRNFEDATGAKSSQSLVVDRRTKLDWQIVQGTPSAGGGAAPKLTGAPAGYTVLGYLYIPAGMGAGLFGSLNLFDNRVPLEGFQRVVIPATHLTQAMVSGWTINYDGNVITSTGATHFYANCPRLTGRIMGVGMSYTFFGGSSDWSIVRRSRSAGVYIDSQPNIEYLLISNTSQFLISGGIWYDNNGFQQSVLPLWANGLGNTTEDAEQDGGTNFPFGLTAFKYTAAAASDTIHGVTWDIAG